MTAHYIERKDSVFMRSVGDRDDGRWMDVLHMLRHLSEAIHEHINNEKSMKLLNSCRQKLKLDAARSKLSTQQLSPRHVEHSPNTKCMHEVRVPKGKYSTHMSLSSFTQSRLGVESLVLWLRNICSDSGACAERHH